MTKEINIKSEILLEYLKPTEKRMDYWQKYNNARHLLSKHPKQLERIEKVRKEVEKKCFGINLQKLQSYLDRSDDLNAFVKFERGNPIKLTLNHIKDILSDFKVKLDDAVFEVYEEEGGVVF